jgi:hypothetical protein
MLRQRACRGRARRNGLLFRLLLAPALVTLAVLASGCLDSSYTFISRHNSDHTTLYFKVPSHWKLFDYNQIIEAANGHLSNTQLSQIEQAQWIVTFGASPHFSPKQAASYGENYPTGAAFAEQIPSTDVDTFSLASLRGELLGSDPAGSGSTDIILSYSEFTAAGGIRGSRMTIDIPIPSGKYITYGQVAMVDAATDYTYAVGIGCYASCWGPNEGLINQILKSWTVKVQK